MSPGFGVGDANTNPPEFAAFLNFKNQIASIGKFNIFLTRALIPLSIHQNTPFQVKQEALLMQRKHASTLSVEIV